MSRRLPELDTVLGNVSRLLDLASHMVIGDMRKVEASDHGPGFHLTEDQGEQLASLLIVTGEYARHHLGEAEQ